jgi:hypothetical protein
MKRALGWVAAFVLLAAPASAGDMGISVGYSFLKYLEDGGGDAPLGFYLSLAGRGKSAIELDLAYHRDTGELIDEAETLETKLETFTALAGFKVGPTPRYGQTSGSKPYFHILGGIRKDWLKVLGSETESNTAWGGMTGLGIDLVFSKSLALRLAADFQMFWDDGDQLETLRFSAGFTF